MEEGTTEGQCRWGFMQLTEHLIACLTEHLIACLTEHLIACLSDGEGEGVWWGQSNSYLRQQKDIKRLGRPRLRKAGVIFQF